MKEKLRKGLTVVTTVAMCMGAMTGCSGNSQSAGASASSDVYKIGGIGPLTGESASYGNSVKQGAEIAIAEINAAGGVNGKQFELIFEDDQDDAEKSISAYNKIMDQNVTAILGGVTSGCSIAIGEESIKDGILQVTPSGSAQNCTKYENAFRICFTDPLQGKTMADYIKDQGFKNVAIIYNVGDEYSKGVTDAFIEEAAANGMNIVAQESFNKGDVDFKTQLTKIKGTEAECIFLPIYYAEVAAITEQAQTIGLNLPYFGSDGWDGVIDQLNGDTSNIEGAIFLTPFVATSEKENVKNFVEAYQKAYNQTPDQFAADGYDGIYAIKLAIEECGDDVTNENLIAAMTKISVNGITGDMTFTADGEPNKSAMVAVIENGQYVAK
ncbi:MAG: ABC transporter substrate-binding protein [Candidatus Cellulosilyticum pullistercoris]|uniref:ABC transporter substrate-binding protein n=1 Tax=Candidatus Cellulosilyticum pullistercoris TaxID=2838521 RepID=A0A9E2KB55_9FIRM|nr:ABC transporter substrate-binding protein [Candidatus Cellulosilyticum pullistercoris]